MKDKLAQALLGRVMGWEEIDAADHLGVLQTLARYKYDHYQRFEPGRKFIESLALWLEQFDAGKERTAAYEFISRRLVFISDSEFVHLVERLYPDTIRQIIREQAAAQIGLPAYRVVAIESSDEFARLRRQSVFLGLSDGARIDRFRRSSRELDNEQVYATYEVAADRRQAMREDLIEDLRDYQTERGAGAFRLVFLIDDFTGSGRTLLREDDGIFSGRLNRFADILRRDGADGAPVFAGRDTRVYVCLYVATQQALDYLNDEIPRLPDPPWAYPPEIRALQVISRDSKVTPEGDPGFAELLCRYYDPEIENKHTKKGGSPVVYGFANCALPLVLEHNTPNNSVYLLWADSGKPVPLFSRMERHR